MSDEAPRNILIVEDGERLTEREATDAVFADVVMTREGKIIKNRDGELDDTEEED